MAYFQDAGQLFSWPLRQFLSLAQALGVSGHLSYRSHPASRYATRVGYQL